MKHVLDLPFGAEEMKEKYGLKTIKGGFSLYSGVLLPRDLRPYKSEDFSYTRWLEDEANAHVSVPDRVGTPPLFTEAQQASMEKLTKAYERGEAGAILLEAHGRERELVALQSLAAMAKSLGAQPWEDDANKAKLLIVTSKGMMAHWRHSIKRMPVVTALMRPLIITPSQLNKLLMAPPAARLTAKKSSKERSTARNGVPTVDWNFIVFDDVFELGAYPSSATAASAVAVAKLNKSYNKTTSPFSLFLINHLEDDPLAYSVMSKVLSRALSKDASITPQAWAAFAKEKGFAVRDTDKGFIWMGNPPKRGPESKILTAAQAKAVAVRDTDKLRATLKASSLVELSKPVQENFVIDQIPLDIRGGHKVLYENIWKDLRTWLNRNLMNTDPEGYARQIARYFWRVNDLKKDYVLELASDLVASGTQVFLKVPTIEAVNHHAEKLTKKRISFVTLTAQNEDDHEAMMEAFDEGEAKMLLATDYLSEPTVPMNVIPTVILTDAQMLSNFARDYAGLFRKQPHVVYLPYVERTIEEALLNLLLSEEVVSDSYNVTPFALEKLFRITAAKTIPPNRMS